MSSDKRKHSGLGCLTFVIAVVLYFVIEELTYPLFYYYYRRHSLNLSTSDIIILLSWIIGQAMLIGSLGALSFKRSSITGKVFAGIGMFISLSVVVVIIFFLINYYIRR